MKKKSYWKPLFTSNKYSELRISAYQQNSYKNWFVTIHFQNSGNAELIGQKKTHIAIGHQNENY